jgi:hypothetical protein
MYCATEIAYGRGNIHKTALFVSRTARSQVAVFVNMVISVGWLNDAIHECTYSSGHMLCVVKVVYFVEY